VTLLKANLWLTLTTADPQIALVMHEHTRFAGGAYFGGFYALRGFCYTLGKAVFGRWNRAHIASALVSFGAGHGGVMQSGAGRTCAGVVQRARDLALAVARLPGKEELGCDPLLRSG